jgi:hypothetical protein
MFIATYLLLELQNLNFDGMRVLFLLAVWMVQKVQVVLELVVFIVVLLLAYDIAFQQELRKRLVH